MAFTSAATDVGAAHAGGDFAQLWLRTLDGSCAGEPAPVLTLSGPSGALPGTSATFTFSASGPAPRFECRVDGAAYKACTSPLTVRGLGPGVHKVEVRAIDAHGNVSSVGSKTVSVAGPPAPAPATGSAGGGERPVTVHGPAVRAPASSVARAVTFTGKTLKRLARGRAIGVPMRCTASTRCAGTVTLSLGGKRLARATFSIRARKAATVRVRLTRAGRRALRGKRSPRIAVVATLRGGATARTTAKLK